MPPKPTSNAPSSATPKPQIISAAVKAAAAASKMIDGVGGGGGSTAGTAPKQPPKKKKSVVKAKRPGAGRISPVAVIGKDDTLHPSKMAVMKNKLPTMAGRNKNDGNGTSAMAVDSIQFSSQHSSPKKKSGSSGGNSGSGSLGSSSKQAVNPATQMQQMKLERAQIAKRELDEMDAIERAFREDEHVWAGPSNVVFPRRYHADAEEASAPNDDGAKTTKNKKDTLKVESEKKTKISSIQNPYLTFYGSQSQGWMYGEGYAGIGGRSWTEATSNKNGVVVEDKDKEKDSTTKKVDPPTQNATEDATSTTTTETANKRSNPSFLMDDVTIIENSLRSNGLTRNDVTPEAYACFLEQARRYALEILADAQDYAIHAQRTTIPALLPADLLLAAEMREDGGGGGEGGVHGVSSTLPTPEQIADVASDMNRVPLPPIPPNCYNGVALPPTERQLTARTYDVVNGARVAQRMMRGGDLPSTAAELALAKKAASTTTSAGAGGAGTKSKSGGGGESRNNSNSGSSTSSKKKKVGSYGAGKGRQISVQIKGNKSSSSGGGGAASAAAAAAAAARKSGGTTGSSSATASSKTKAQKRKLTEL